MSLHKEFQNKRNSSIQTLHVKGQSVLYPYNAILFSLKEQKGQSDTLVILKDVMPNEIVPSWRDEYSLGPGAGGP